MVMIYGDPSTTKFRVMNIVWWNRSPKYNKAHKQHRPVYGRRCSMG
jgi:hypothetical protein